MALQLLLSNERGQKCNRRGISHDGSRSERIDATYVRADPTAINMVRGHPELMIRIVPQPRAIAGPSCPYNKNAPKPDPPIPDREPGPAPLSGQEGLLQRLVLSTEVKTQWRARGPARICHLESASITALVHERFWISTYRIFLEQWQRSQILRRSYLCGIDP